MEILLSSIVFTADLVFRMGSVMFISLFGVELFMQMGLMRHLKPFGKPVARAARLPAETAVCFLAAIGSMIAAHTMAAQFHADGRLNDRELRLTGVLKLCYVLICGRAWGNRKAPLETGEDPFSAYECSLDDPECLNRSLTRLLKDAWHARKKMFFNMIGVLAVVTLLVQVLTLSGMLSWVEAGIAPLTSALGLSPAVIGPLTTYIFSPIAGISYMSTLLTQNSISGYEAITALIAGGLLMIPVTRLRRTLPRYIAIYGGRNGSFICLLTMGFGLLSRILVLAWIILFY